VNYSYRFFDETLKDPATASPLIFPEAVFAAPASHVASLLGHAPLVYTLLGDPASFLQGLALGAEWLEEQRIDACLVIGAEETNWLLADALWHLDHRAILSGGAGAVCLSLDPSLSVGVELERITDAHPYTAIQSRSQAARAMRAELPASSPEQLLCDSIGDSPRTDAPEIAVWRDWSGARLSPKRILGEGLMAAGAWQCVAVSRRPTPASWVATSTPSARGSCAARREFRIGRPRPERTASCHEFEGCLYHRRQRRFGPSHRADFSGLPGGQLHHRLRTESGRWHSVMNNTATLKQDIKQMMVENLMLQITADEIGDEVALFGPGGLALDSVDALQLVVALDKKYGLKIPDPDTARLVLQSVKSMTDSVATHLNASSSQPNRS
jgi:acyl carrier protein